MMLLAISFTTILEAFVVLVLLISGISFRVWQYRMYHEPEHSEKEIIEAEKKRKECPEIQSGKFTRLYTMPYWEDLDSDFIMQCIKEKHPEYHCSRKWKSELVVREKGKSFFSGEKRELVIIQLRSEDITAIEFSDPHEYDTQNRRTIRNIRTSLYDQGFGESLRVVIRQIQEQAIKRNTKR